MPWVEQVRELARGRYRLTVPCQALWSEGTGRMEGRPVNGGLGGTMRGIAASSGVGSALTRREPEPTDIDDERIWI